VFRSDDGYETTTCDRLTLRVQYVESAPVPVFLFPVSFLSVSLPSALLGSSPV